MNCKRCIYWEEHGDNPSFGFCKRYAPNPTTMPVNGIVEFQIIWPSTGKDDWCGEHKSE